MCSKALTNQLGSVSVSAPLNRRFIMRRISRFNQQRRDLLLGALAGSMVPLSHAIANTTSYPELRLKLYNLHTTEKIDTVFWQEGEFNLDALADLNHLLRDHRTGEAKSIDPKLFSVLYLLNKKVSNDNAISVISGYRSAETNRKLAKQNSGVASNSYHIKGRAIDIRIPGRDTKELREAGLRLRVGGVGYYARSNFAHFDTGPFRTW